MNSDCEKSNRRFSPGPTLNGQALDQYKPTPIQNLIQYLLQPRSEHRQRYILGGNLFELYSRSL
jgi:hypothetical protein